MKSGIKKSIGDYGQEFTALSKYGATTKDKYKTVNMITAGGNKTIPYNENGNAFRIMVANDRPSAYRGIFMLLFADQKNYKYKKYVRLLVSTKCSKKYTSTWWKCFIRIRWRF